MSHRHVPATTWASLARGAIEPERAALEAAAAACPTCATARARVESARAALVGLAAEPPPALAWDSIGARLGWALAAEDRRRTALVHRRRWQGRAGLLLGTGVALAAAAVLLVTRPWESAPVPGPSVAGRQVAPAAPAPAPAPGVAAPVAAEAALVAIEGLVTLVEAGIPGRGLAAPTIDGLPVSLATRIRVGSEIVTTRGRVAVQLGPRDGFVVAAASRLRATALDGESIELVLEQGAVELELVRRRPSQRFVVLAGTRRIEVRGTEFRVQHDAQGVTVSVTRGRVAVIDGDQTVEVPAGTGLALPVAPGIPAGAAPSPLTASVDPSAPSAVPLLRDFTDAGESAVRTGGVEVTAPRGVARVDGHVVGLAPLALRVDAGRHLVEVGAVSRWVDVEPGVVTPTTLVGAPPRSERPAQLDAALVKLGGAFEVCARSSRKVDPSFAGDLELEIGVRADGALDYVTPVRGLGDRHVETCVLDAVRERLVLPPGSAGRIRKTLRF